MCVGVFSVPQLIYSGKLDFLVFDYLSEITMSLLTAAKAKMPVSPTSLRLCALLCCGWNRNSLTSERVESPDDLLHIRSLKL